MNDQTEVLVPQRRLGALLRQTRAEAGLELYELARRSERFSVADLEELENGLRRLDDETLLELVDLYKVPDVGLVPERSRLVIDLDEGRISIDHEDYAVSAQGPDTVLARYLALVYRLRGLPVGAAINLRDVDVDVLSTALELQPDEIEGRLEQLITDGAQIDRAHRSLPRRLLLPVVGIVVASTAVGTILIVADNDPAAVTTGAATGRLAGVIEHDSAALPPVDVVTDIGEPAVVESGAGSDDPAAVELSATAIDGAAIVEAGGDQAERP